MNVRSMNNTRSSRLEMLKGPIGTVKNSSQPGSVRIAKSRPFRANFLGVNDLFVNVICNLELTPLDRNGRSPSARANSH